MEQTNSQTESQTPSKRYPVVPGELIKTGDDFLPGEGTKRSDSGIVSLRFGLAEEIGKVIRVLPITGAYIPRSGNTILGRVTDINFRGWTIDIDYASQGFLPIDESPRYLNKGEMSQFLSIGDVVSAKVDNVSSRGIDLILEGKGLGRLDGGFIFRVIPCRVPRIIGKEGSMISLIKENTGCQITVGQNGWVWIQGPTIKQEILARNAIEYIASHILISGLTEKMEEWFSLHKNDI